MRRLRACVPHPASAQAGRALRPSAGSGVRPWAPTPRAPPGASLPTLPFGSFPKTFAGSPGRPGPAAAAREVTTQLAAFPWQLWCCHEAPWREVAEAEEGIPGFSAARGHVLRHWSVAWRSRPSGPCPPCPAPPFTSPHSLPGLPPGSDSQWRAGPACDPGPPTALLINLAGFSSVILVHSFTNIHSANLGPALCRALGLHDKACAAVERAFIKCLLCAESCAGADTGTQQWWRHTWFLPLQRWQSSGGDTRSSLRGDPPGGAVRRRRPGVLLGGGSMGVQAAVQGPGPALL